jgi:4-hydroxy-3-methylbut-2-enyl diphosphate reductase
MKILRATHLGMCFGVRDALALAETHARSQPLSILGDLVHNDSVLARLRAQGVAIQHQVADLATPHVMITAHGASERTLAAVRDRGFQVTEATCPLVHHAHRMARSLVGQGFHLVVIGRRDHVEVRGLTEDFDAFDVVLDATDVEQLTPRSRFGVVAQTTQPIERVQALVGLIERRFPESEVRFLDTVCQPTKQRQNAAVELARRCDVVVVIGGAHSNNTRELADTCARFCPRVHHVQTEADLRSVWFRGDETVGITAGTSTPDDVIERVATWLNDFAAFQSELAQLQPPSLHETPDSARAV